MPSGNFGNLCAALFAREMGLPIKRFIAANNANDVFFKYLQTGTYHPKPSILTIANAMDVGNPSNFARILDLYGESYQKISALISGSRFTDEEIRTAIRTCYERTSYILDPHGACGYQALCQQLQTGEHGLFCETAHPAKFKETVDALLPTPVPIPERLSRFLQGQKQTLRIENDFAKLKALLL